MIKYKNVNNKMKRSLVNSNDTYNAKKGSGYHISLPWKIRYLMHCMS